MAFHSAPRAYTPHLAADTLKSGSGDSADEAVLLIQKLAELGIAAKAALINAEPHPDVLRDLAGLEAFDRVLVYIPGPHPLWIDPAAEFTPVSRLPVADQGRWALIVDPASTDLVRTPESSAADNRESHAVELHLQDGAAATMMETIEGWGAFDDLLRPVANILNGTDADQRDAAQTRLARGSGMQHVTKAEAGDPKKLLTPCRVQMTGEGYAASEVTDDGGFVDLPGLVSANLQRLAAALRLEATNSAIEPSARKFDYYIPPAFTDESTYHVVLPLGYAFKELPQPASFAVGPLQLTGTAKFDPDGSLQLVYRMVSPKNRYTPQEVEAMRHDAAKLAGKLRIRIAFYNVAEAKLASGDLNAAINLFRKDSAAAPSNIAARLRLADAYVNAGARAEAVTICQDVLAKNPGDAAVYARLGWIYSHDEFGRPYSAGMNMAEAEKAYLKALDLEANRGYAVQLARLYTFNSAGIRFGASARLGDALHLYNEAGLDTVGRSGAINDYAVTLLFARRYSELRKFFLYSQADRADPGIKLAGMAAGSGLDDVKDEAAYEFPDAAKRKIMFTVAARYLLLSREFAPAVSLFDMAGSGGQGISAGDLALIRKAKGFDESAASSQPAIAAFQRFVNAVLNPPDTDSWRKFVVPERRGDSWARMRLQLLQLFGKQEAARQSINWPWISDVLATAVDYSAQTDNETGRIRIMGAIGKSAPKVFAYVSKRGNDYLILNVADAPPAAAEQKQFEEALQQASAGQLKEARENAYHLMDEGGDSSEVLAIFGRIAEQLDLRDAAANYYQRVQKPEEIPASSAYAFAQTRLQAIAASKASASKP